MRKRTVAIGIAGLLVAGGAVGAYIVSPTVHAGQIGEAPELGRTGEYAIGTFEKNFALSSDAVHAPNVC